MGKLIKLLSVKNNNSKVIDISDPEYKKVMLKTKAIEIINDEINKVNLLRESSKNDLSNSLLNNCEGSLVALTTIKAFLLNNEDILDVLNDIFIKRIPELVDYQKEKKDFSDGHFTMGYLSALRIVEFKLKQLIE